MADRPVNWNVLTVDSRVPERVPRQLQAADRAAELGSHVVALTMPVQVPMNMSFLNFCGLWLIPGWQDVLGVPVAEPHRAVARCRHPRAIAGALASTRGGVFRRLADWAQYIIGDTYTPENDGLKGRSVGEIAAERGRSWFGTLLDIVIADDLRTVLWPTPQDDDEQSWAMRRELWADDRAMIGGSDAGAHLDRMCGAPYPTRFLADCLHGRRLVPVERAIELMTSAPAALFGLRDRGVLASAPSPTSPCSTPPASVRVMPPSCAICRVIRPGSRRRRRASCGCSSAASRSSSTDNRPAPRRGSSSAPDGTPRRSPPADERLLAPFDQVDRIVVTDG